MVLSFWKTMKIHHRLWSNHIWIDMETRVFLNLSSNSGKKTPNTSNKYIWKRYNNIVLKKWFLDSVMIPIADSNLLLWIKHFSEKYYFFAIYVGYRCYKMCIPLTYYLLTLYISIYSCICSQHYTHIGKPRSCRFC